MIEFFIGGIEEFFIGELKEVFINGLEGDSIDDRGDTFKMGGLIWMVLL